MERKAMLRIKLANRTYEPDDHPFLQRILRGWDPTMTERETYDAARGWWVLGDHVERERYAVIVGGSGDVVMAIEIHEWHHDEARRRRAFAGSILGAGDPVYDRYVGSRDPALSQSRNAIAYFEGPFDSTTCLCGCGGATSSDWLPGHDQRAIHQRITRDFSGSVRRFIEWYDSSPRVGSVHQ
jgi:hypothetical protein